MLFSSIINYTKKSLRPHGLGDFSVRGVFLQPLFKRSAAIVAAASISAQKQKKDDDPTAVVAAVVITATATVVSTATHQTDDPKDTGAAVSTVSKQGISAAIITATVIVTSTSCATSGITTTSAITSTIGSR